jgi:excisionase family DNA binding protein
MNEPLLTYDEAAAVLGIAPRTLSAWVARGRLPVVVLSHTVRRIRRSDLDAFVAERVRRVSQGRRTPALRAPTAAREWVYTPRSA